MLLNPEPRAPNSNLFLIGPRGSGKTTVARLLAERLGWGWVDADALLEARCGQSIRQVFDEEGEAGFREHEAAVLAEISRGSRQVVATGGGVVLRDDNRDCLASAGRVVWLHADPATLWRRVRGDAATGEQRPNLTAAGGLAEMEEVLRQREPLYRHCADWQVETAGKTPETIAAEIHALLAAAEKVP